MTDLGLLPEQYLKLVHGVRDRVLEACNAYWVLNKRAAQARYLNPRFKYALDPLGLTFMGLCMRPDVSSHLQSILTDTQCHLVLPKDAWEALSDDERHVLKAMHNRMNSKGEPRRPVGKPRKDGQPPIQRRSEREKEYMEPPPMPVEIPKGMSMREVEANPNLASLILHKSGEEPVIKPVVASREIVMPPIECDEFGFPI